MPSSWWRHWHPCMSAAQRRFQAPSPEPVWKSPAAPTDLRPAARGWRSGPLCIGSGEAVRGWVRVSGHLDAPAAVGLSPLPELAACELARALGSSRRPEGAECSGNVAGSSGAGLAHWAEQNMASAPRWGGGAGMADTRPHEVGSAQGTGGQTVVDGGVVLTQPLLGRGEWLRHSSSPSMMVRVGKLPGYLGTAGTFPAWVCECHLPHMVGVGVMLAAGTRVLFSADAAVFLGGSLWFSFVCMCVLGCVCVSLCVHVCLGVCMSLHVHVCWVCVHTSACVRVSLRVHVCLGVCMSLRVHVCLGVCSCVCTCAWGCVCVLACARMLRCVRTRVCVCVRVLACARVLGCVCLRVFVHVCAWVWVLTRVCMCVCACPYVCTSVGVCAHMSACVCVSLRVHMCLGACRCVYVHVCVCTCVCSPLPQSGRKENAAGRSYLREGCSLCV
ncbi:uncharacterized protein LOC144336056 [Macaca mulatta]